MLKKLLATVMAVALLAGCVVGCQPAEDSDIPAASTTTENTTTSSTSRTTVSTYYAGTPDAPNMPQFGGGGSSKIVMGDKIERVFNFKDPLEYIRRFDEILSKKDEIVEILKNGRKD